MARRQTPPPVRMGWLTFLALALTAATLAEDIPLECQPEWTLIDYKCYRLFSHMLPWDSASNVCKSYGSQLVRVKDFYDNKAVKDFAMSKGYTQYWIGSSRKGVPGTNEKKLVWSDGETSNIVVGHWQENQPEVADTTVQCVEGGKWSLSACETKLPFVCQRAAAPQGSFHCHNGHFVRQGITCDGEDDCGDGSDELDCSNQCAVHFKNQMSGVITSPSKPSNYPSKKVCSWLIEVPVSYNVKLQFTDFRTESGLDEILILAGGQTVSTSYLVTRLSGDLSSPLPVITSINNFMMVLFTSDGSVSFSGFTANFAAVKDEGVQPVNYLTATMVQKELISPFYMNYLGSQDYTWIITAEHRSKSITLEIVEVDLKGQDRILIRDGDKVTDPLLARLTASGSTPTYLLSRGHKLYITMQTRSLETGKGFKFRYWEGCSVTLTGVSGEITSPGFVMGQYGTYQECIYNVNVSGNAPVTVRFDKLKLHKSDGILVYEDNMLLHNVSESNSPAPFSIDSGSFRMVFESDAILTSEGFKIVYSIACPDPYFNADTVWTPSVSSFVLGTDFTVSCKSGSVFYAEQFQDDSNEPLDSVRLVCQPGGKWNVPVLPMCEPIYCGPAPPVQNAYVENSTGVTFQGTVTYLCYPGFAMTGDNPIRCTENGTWTKTPTCKTSSCSPLPAVNNAAQNITSGDGANFSSVVEYSCSSGYQIVGEPLLFCQSDGNWTSSVPSCEGLQCYVPPSIPNGMLEKGGEMINVGDMVNVSCDAGYTNSTGGATVMVTCQHDRSLQGLNSFHCVYQNKCPGNCAHDCHDSEFENLTCSCRDGYTLKSDMSSCENIDECQTDNGGCDQLCTDTEGGYQCSCNDGYVLFTSDGVEGFSLAPNEDGMRPGDVRRFNHTCLRVKCPSPPTVGNGTLIVKQDSYHYEDFVEYLCLPGFVLNGSSMLTCNKDRQWDKNAPQCNPAVCQPDTPDPSAENPAVITPSGPVGYGEKVTLTCNVPGKAPYNTSRYCVYYEGQYQLVGDDYDCGLIDCKQPATVAGSDYSGSVTNTTYGASFVFACQNLYSVEGSSAENETIQDKTVRCTARGEWDFGSLRCSGLTCQDPGHPPDGKQVNTNSYDQGDLVYFECNKPGFTLSDPHPLLCQLNSTGTGLEWNGTAPSCVDSEPPVLTGCPSETRTVQTYTPASTVVTLPTAKDNVGVWNMHITSFYGTTWPSDDLILSNAAENFNISFTDFAGNTDFCEIKVTTRDNIPPSLECPDKIVKTFKEENQTIHVMLSEANVSGTADSYIFNPSDLRFLANDQYLVTGSFPPYRSYEVTVDAMDSYGNQANCTFPLTFEANACSPFTLRQPLHGKKSCNATSSGFDCTLSCDDGYVFRDQHNSPSLHYNCTDGQSWNAPVIPACTKANDPNQQAGFQQTFRFNFTQDTPGPCSIDVYRDILAVNVSAANAIMPTLCSAPGFNGTLTISDISQTNDKIYLDVKFTYNIDKVAIQSCPLLVKVNFEDKNLEIVKFFMGQFSPATCPAISNSDAGTMVLEGYFCESGKLIEIQPEGQVCVGCPEGTRKVGSDSCELCPEGTFNPSRDNSVCEACPGTTSTFSPGAVSNGECTALCGPGLYSTSGLPPCSLCPTNTYSVNSTFCMPCPADSITRQKGATKPSDCLPPCPEGTYNLIDGHGHGSDCTVCPLHFYANQTGSPKCSECPQNKKTVTNGSTSETDCKDIGCPGSSACKNGGTCLASRHTIVCTCPDGYNGRFCELEVDPCSSNPCYFNGSCTRDGSGFNCTCTAGTEGTRCEKITETCAPDYCLNGGACRNVIGGQTCLCKSGFSGDKCQNTSDICQSAPCVNGGTCVPQGNIRYRCECPSGYEGSTCETDTDDCAPNPCLHGGSCTDSVNDFDCSCPTGFSGKRCEERLNLCDTANCGGDECVEDIQANTYHCVCNEGSYYGTVCQYESTFGQQINGTVAPLTNASGSSIQQCMELCKQKSCEAFLFDNDASECWIYDTTLALQPGNQIYYRRLCMKVEESYWTPWYDSSTPNNTATGLDDELLTTLDKYGLDICKGSNAIKAECRIVGSGAAPSDNLDVACTPSEGLLCKNEDQTGTQCQDYEIRFMCLSSRVVPPSPCEDISYCSNSSVCQNGGTCVESQTGATCNCKAGYTGSLCQHSVDDCASDPCLNGASCTDQHNGFDCDCAPGFSGSRCETEIDDCTPNPCNQTGSQQCLDHINRYECQCKPGFTGRHCEAEIDECLSQPCLHDGTCMDQENAFTCTCKPGWEGSMCQDIKEVCMADTCEQGANCINIFDDFYCRCPPNTFGKTCSNAPSVCSNANPCLHNSSCDEDKGVAECQCNPEFKGEGCHIRRDMCSESDPQCQNGATCSISDGNFACTCPVGYTGRFCEENIDDCQGNNCPANSTCIDMVNQHFCRCPVGKSGEDCGKETDRQFDLLFSGAEKPSMAVLRYPLHLAGSGFSITMWIQNLRKDNKGTFFTLYKVRDPNSLSEKEELVRLDHDGATISLNNEVVEIEKPVNYNEYGLWHYIAITWDKDSGLLSFFVNTVRDPVRTYNQGMSLDMSVWMVLGCGYDPDTDMCRKDQGFHGVISQVTLYNRSLEFASELTLQGNENAFQIFKDAVMTWGEFLQYPGVTRVYPSKVDPQCGRGSGHPVCITPKPGKTMVGIDQDSCPKDIIVFGSQRITQVAWPEIKFSDGGGQIVQKKHSHYSDSLFLWGKYPVVVEGSDTDGNKALCTFDIYVQYDVCTTPNEPVNASSVFCSYFTDEEDRDYKGCTAICPSALKLVNPLKLATCGPVGSFDPLNRYLPFVFPPCGATTPPNQRLVIKIKYQVLSTECSVVERELQDDIKDSLVTLNMKWSDGLCKSTDCSDIQLDSNCTLSGSSPMNTDIDITIKADDVPKTLTNSDDASLTISPEDLLRQLILSYSLFDFDDNVAGAVPDPDGLIIQIQFLCHPPLALVGDTCVECAEGTHYDASTETCVLCPIGEYQDQSNQTACKPCDSGYTTETVGSITESQCKTICSAGEYFDKGNDACALCPQGFYQNTSGLFYCLPCPVDKTTRSKGADSSSICFNDCPIGEELSVNGTCTLCAIGFYKPAGPTVCQRCPPGLVTNITGADSKDDCNVADNPAGYFRSRDNETQALPCPQGTYQPQKWQYDCISCGSERYRTDNEGSDSVDDCKFFCPAGQQQVGDTETCEECLIGFYKEGSDFYGSCKPCPENARTPTNGSISVDNCTITYCTAGYKINGSDCEKCPKGEYQDQPYKNECKSCGEGKSTRQEGSKSASDCEKFCEPGSEKNPVSGECDDCPRGYYKNNDDDVFMECTACPIDYVTPTNASTSENDCTIRNCSEGYSINNDTCQPCDYGEYQPLKWQTDCLKCDPHKNTSTMGAVSKSECFLNCSVGKENPADTEECVDCPQGTYKDKEGATPCTDCPAGNVTRNNGSTSLSDCNLRACSPGSYADSSRGGECTSCGYGEYQPNKWQEGCLTCKAGLTTYQLGTASEDLCLESCPNGKQFNMTSQSCEPCPRGFYNDGSKVPAICTPCDVDFITSSTGATSNTNCTVRNCTNPGQYLDTSDNSCKDCPIGQWQNQKWQTSCNQCGSGKTTKDEGSSDLSDCKLDCIDGHHLVNDQCEPCMKGYYRNKSESWECLQCPQDLTTQAPGAASKDECSLSTCVAGKYFDGESQKCEPCKKNFYQNKTGQFQCESCPLGFETNTTGATSKSDCKDKCNVQTSTCDVNAKCTPLDDGNVTCTCKSGYTGNGTNCAHICDVERYCQNSASCDRTLLRCICTDNYEGERCELRKDPQKELTEKDIIVMATVIPIIVILFIILIVVCCLIKYRNQPKTKDPSDNMDERTSLATRLSTRAYDNFGADPLGKPSSIPISAQQMYDNPTYTLHDVAVYKV